MNKFDIMAQQRNEEAKHWSDADIHKSIIRKIFALLNLPIEDRSIMAIESVGDNRFIYEELKLMQKEELVSTMDMCTILKTMSRYITSR